MVGRRLSARLPPQSMFRKQQSTPPEFCAGCYECDPEWIAPSVSTDPDTEWLVSFYCNQPFHERCDAMPPCPYFQPLAAELQRSLAAGDNERVAAMITRQSDKVIVVPERSALQVMDCTGEQVGAQIPLTAAALEALWETRP